MNPEERLQTAISLGKPDRIPCAPLIESYAGRRAGLTNYEFMYDYKKAEWAFNQLHRQYPSWDVMRSVYFVFHGHVQKVVGFMKPMMPGVDLPPDSEYQMVEYEAITRRDYYFILEAGYQAFQRRYWKRVHQVSDEQIDKANSLMLDILKSQIKNAKARGQTFLYGGFTVLAPPTLSLMRSLGQFIRDMYQIPSTLESVLQEMTEALTADAIAYTRETGIPRVFVGVARLTCQLISEPLFERFVWPYLKKTVLDLLAAGITPILHLDSDWTKNLEYFLELPAGKVAIELDGTTDIFKAHQVLCGHTCIIGDVGAPLFTLGTSDQVQDYCRKLIQEIGRDGGFILGSGCHIPLLAKHENVDAFFRSITG
ncbi:MAG TPA: uroporphyrinogen-III decarboxylase [Syntrophomonadaceae bacterium]|nr:uroporphyrinogen-III decarboxylase [Syntrophomonadaceae bacterium]